MSGEGGIFNLTDRWEDGDDDILDVELIRGGGHYEGTYVGYVRVHISRSQLAALDPPTELIPNDPLEERFLAAAFDEIRRQIAAGEFVPGANEPPWDIPVDPADVFALAASDESLEYGIDDDPPTVVEIIGQHYNGSIERRDRLNADGTATAVLDLTAYAGDHYLFIHAHCPTEAVDGERTWRALEILGARRALAKIQAGDFQPTDYAEVRPDPATVVARLQVPISEDNWEWHDKPWGTT